MTTAAKKPANGRAAKKGLGAKLLVAQIAAGNVPKRGHNQKQNYDYVRAEDVIDHASQALHDAGLVCSMSFGEPVVREITSRGGGAGLLVTLPATLRIIDPDTGETHETDSCGMGSDYPGDKAVYKAMTGATKYAYAAALGIGFGDDPEDEAPSRTAAVTATAQPVQRSERPVTGKQKGLIHALSEKAGLSDDEQKAIAQWVGGVAVVDRLSSKLASKMIDALGEDGADAPSLLGEIRGSEDERAKKIVERYLTEKAAEPDAEAAS